MDTPRHRWGGRRIAADLAVGLLALVAAFLFFAAPEGGSPALHGTAGANPNMMPPPPPPPPGNSNGGGNTNSCSCVNGVCSGNACPKSNPPPPPPPPPAGNFGPPPPPRRVTPPPPPPAGAFVPEAPAAAVVAPVYNPTAAVSADTPKTGISAGASATLNDTKLIDVGGSPKQSNRGVQAAGVALGIAGLATGLAALGRGGPRAGAGIAAAGLAREIDQSQYVPPDNYHAAWVASHSGIPQTQEAWTTTPEPPAPGTK